jgi:hypothetical protein
MEVSITPTADHHPAKVGNFASPKLGRFRGPLTKGPHRDDRAASGQPKQAAHARSAKVKPLHATLARRALLAWIQWQRRILIRWEYHAHNFLGFVQLACPIILFKRF